jgi:hypothetical protein
MADEIGRVVRCGCGAALRAEDEADLLELAERHVAAAHPELVGTLSPLELARSDADEDAAA